MAATLNYDALVGVLKAGAGKVKGAVDLLTEKLAEPPEPTREPESAAVAS